MRGASRPIILRDAASRARTKKKKKIKGHYSIAKSFAETNLFPLSHFQSTDPNPATPSPSCKQAGTRLSCALVCLRQVVWPDDGSGLVAAAAIMCV
jgi:hypothetical protein